MKKIILASIIVVVSLGSCTKLEEFNENPNNVSETHPQLLLTDIEWNAFQVEGTGPMFASRMIVQTDGENVNQYYKWDRSGFGDYGSLRSVTRMIIEAERVESPVCQALGKFFRSYYFFNLTRTFGDVPYSEALKGESDANYAPSYDSQKDVFIGVLQELKEADDLLQSDNSIIAGDIIFSGSTQQWRKLINSFRLKVLLSLSGKETDNDLNIVSSFASIVSGSPIMESLADNGQIIFLDEVGSRYTEYNNSGYGSARYMDSTFIKMLQDRQDPRLFIYCGQTKVAKEAGLALDDFDSYEGGNPIAPYNDVNIKAAAGLVSKVNLRYTTDPVNEPHMLMGYPELQFILAEARVRGWISASDAEIYYNNGVKSSFEFYHTNAQDYASLVDDVAADNYLSQPLVDFDNTVSDEERIERIITQKYLQSFLQGGWTIYFDHLRTGYPDFIHLPGSTPPTRWMYPTSEYQENGENVTEAITIQFGQGNDKIREITWWMQ